MNVIGHIVESGGWPGPIYGNDMRISPQVEIQLIGGTLNYCTVSGAGGLLVDTFTFMHFV